MIQSSQAENCDVVRYQDRGFQHQLDAGSHEKACDQTADIALSHFQAESATALSVCYARHQCHHL